MFFFKMSDGASKMHKNIKIASKVHDFCLDIYAREIIETV